MEEKNGENFKKRMETILKKIEKKNFRKSF